MGTSVHINKVSALHLNDSQIKWARLGLIRDHAEHTRARYGARSINLPYMAMAKMKNVCQRISSVSNEYMRTHIVNISALFEYIFSCQVLHVPQGFFQSVLLCSPVSHLTI